MTTENKSTGPYIDRSGIYPEVKGAPTKESTRQVFRMIAERMSQPIESAETHLDRLESQLREITKPYFEERSNDKVGLSGTLKGDAPPQVHDAVSALQKLLEIRNDLENCTLEEALCFGIGIGQMVEKCNVRTFEPLVREARNYSKGRGVGTARQKNAASERDQKAIALFHELTVLHPNWGREKKYEEIAEKLGLKSGDTIGRRIRKLV